MAGQLRYFGKGGFPVVFPHGHTPLLQHRNTSKLLFILMKNVFIRSPGIDIVLGGRNQGRPWVFFETLHLLSINKIQLRLQCVSKDIEEEVRGSNRQGSGLFGFHGILKLSVVIQCGSLENHSGLAFQACRPGKSPNSDNWITR